MSTTSQTIVNKAWNLTGRGAAQQRAFVNGLYEADTFCSFAKMADELNTAALQSRKPIVPPRLDWPSLMKGSEHGKGTSLSTERGHH